MPLTPASLHPNRKQPNPRCLPLTSLLFGLLLFSMWSGCRADYISEQQQEIPSGIWTYADSITLSFSVEDTSRLYRLEGLVTHSDEYGYQNLYVDIHTNYPSGKRSQQPLSIDLADNSGRWYGNCRGGACRINIDLQPKVKFDETGTYRLVFHQYMRKESIEGIESIGIRLAYAEE